MARSCNKCGGFWDQLSYVIKTAGSNVMCQIGIDAAVEALLGSDCDGRYEYTGRTASVDGGAPGDAYFRKGSSDGGAQALACVGPAAGCPTWYSFLLSGVAVLNHWSVSYLTCRSPIRFSVRVWVSEIQVTETSSIEKPTESQPSSKRKEVRIGSVDRYNFDVGKLDTCVDK